MSQPPMTQLTLPIVVSCPPVIVLRHYGAAGVWGYDVDGELWGTFAITGHARPPFVECAICGWLITEGYQSGYRTGRQHVCCRHVGWVDVGAG